MEKKIEQSQEYTKPMLMTHEPLRDITANGSGSGMDATAVPYTKPPW